MMILRHYITILFLMGWGWNSFAVKIEKKLLYDKHTLQDTYKYGKQERRFQWDKISMFLDSLEAFQERNDGYGMLRNYKNVNGEPPLTRKYVTNRYKQIQDSFGVNRYQGIPLYRLGNVKVPFRYGRDGAYVSVISDSADYFQIIPATFGGVWHVPKKYMKLIGPLSIKKVIFVDRTNQNIATLEQEGATWLVRSMNPITTGANRPPYQQPTPPGIYFIQRKLLEMLFLKDGSDEEGGFAPYASRFTGGAYLHGVPVNYPDNKLIEYSWTLGTTPRSHMCVRNATSHAKFMYDWAEVEKTLVIVFD